MVIFKIYFQIQNLKAPKQPTLQHLFPSVYGNKFHYHLEIISVDACRIDIPNMLDE